MNEHVMCYGCVFSNVFLVSPHVDTVTLEKRVAVEFIFFRELAYVIDFFCQYILESFSSINSTKLISSS